MSALEQHVREWVNGETDVMTETTHETTETEREQQVAALSLEMSLHCIDNGSLDNPSKWSVTIKKGNAELSVPYQQGAAHRVLSKSNRRFLWKRIHGERVYLGPGDPVPFGFGRTLFEQDQKTEPKTPTLTEVLWCVYMDACGVRYGQTFEEWAEEFGYSDDSIKAKDTYEACRDEYAGLLRLGLSLDDLDLIYEEY